MANEPYEIKATSASGDIGPGQIDVSFTRDMPQYEAILKICYGIDDARIAEVKASRWWTDEHQHMRFEGEPQVIIKHHDADEVAPHLASLAAVDPNLAKALATTTRSINIIQNYSRTEIRIQTGYWFDGEVRSSRLFHLSSQLFSFCNDFGQEQFGQPLDPDVAPVIISAKLLDEQLHWANTALDSVASDIRRVAQWALKTYGSDALVRIGQEPPAKWKDLIATGAEMYADEEEECEPDDEDEQMEVC